MHNQPGPAAQQPPEDLTGHLAWALRRIETAGLDQGENFAAADAALVRAQQHADACHAATAQATGAAA